MTRPPASAPLASRATARRGPRLLAGGVLLGTALFAAFYGRAMTLYPGGTWNDRSTRGHRFWGNFFCDVQRVVALNGAPNPRGALYGRLAATALYASWVPLWLLAPRVLGPSKAARGARALGLVASLVALSLPFAPGHAAGVLAAALPGLVAMGLAVALLARAPGAPRVLRGLTAVFALLALAHAALYVASLVRGDVPAALPAIQKVAAVALLAWMGSFAAAGAMPLE